MLCAHTVRRLKPGTFEQFCRTFSPPDDEPPRGWISFQLLRGLADPNEVVTFGFFDGTLKELEQSQEEMGYGEQRAAVDDLVDAVIASGVYEVVDSWSAPISGPA